MRRRSRRQACGDCLIGTCTQLAGSVTVRVDDHGKTTVTLKFTARAKRSLRPAKRAKLKIAVRFTPRNGAATAATTTPPTVTLTR